MVSRVVPFKIRVRGKYGDACRCCSRRQGEVDLVLDHVFGYRGEGPRSGTALWRKADREPKSPDLQLLCSDCNSQKTRGGWCRLHERRLVVPCPVSGGMCRCGQSYADDGGLVDVFHRIARWHQSPQRDMVEEADIVTALMAALPRAKPTFEAFCRFLDEWEEQEELEACAAAGAPVRYTGTTLLTRRLCR